VQQQFLDVVDCDEAHRRFRTALDLRPLGSEEVPLEAALGRILAADMAADVDVPSFDRSNLDGFAVRAEDTFGASEEAPRQLRRRPETIHAGPALDVQLAPGEAVSIATGGMLPRGSDAIVMVEHAEEQDGALAVRKAVTPGLGVTFAGTDIAQGEIVLHGGQMLTSRETGVLAALGASRVPVRRRPRVAILSTGDELISPGEPMRPGLVYDSNARILADAVRELGGEPLPPRLIADDAQSLREAILEGLSQADLVLLSGGTSKGEGDLSYRVVAELRNPGIVAHGVALKPGKPLCLAVTGGKPVVVLPGFPTSAIFTFHEFVAPVLRAWAGNRTPATTSATHKETPQSVAARLAVRVNSEIGRTEYLLVGLVEAGGELTAFPMGKGSGSVTTFSAADGFVTIGRHEEILEAGTQVSVQLLSRDLRLADLVAIGSHCVGLDLLLAKLNQQGFTTKSLAVGSTAGLLAAERGECDIAGIHLLDTVTLTYNRPFLKPGIELISGYRRMQGVLYRRGDRRFEGRTAEEAVAATKDESSCAMVNRNAGSGTRILIDRLLGATRPAGYAVQPRSHNAVAAAVAQGRADWGLAIESVARQKGLGFLPLVEEHYDFAVPAGRLQRPAVTAFRALLADAAVQEQLTRRGFRLA
jgi:putative molybdopterin biosynthesis protein